MNGWLMDSNIFFSDLTCSIYFNLIISLFFKHFRARGSASGGSLLCFTRRTLPKVPVPKVDKNLKSFRRNLPVAFLLRRSPSSSSSAFAIEGVNTLKRGFKLTCGFSENVSWTLLGFALGRNGLKLSFKLLLLLLKSHLLLLLTLDLIVFFPRVILVISSIVLVVHVIIGIHIFLFFL